MIGILYIWMVCFHWYAKGQDDDTSFGRHPERMLARLLPGQHQVHARIAGKNSSGVLYTGMPVMVLDRDAHATIQSLGLEPCTSAHARRLIIT